MSQIDLQKLTKKNQEFVHIATQQFIKDGKTDAEIKAIFEEVIPQILEEQTKGTTARSLYGAPTHWAHSFTVKEQYEKEHPKENRQRPHNFLCGGSGFRLWIGHSPISWTCWWICLLLDVLLCLPILWTRYGPQSASTFLEICTGYPSFYVPLVACLLCNKLPTS